MDYYFKNKQEYYFYQFYFKSVKVDEVYDILEINLNGGTWYELRNGKLTNDPNIPVGKVIDIYTDMCSCPVRKRCNLDIFVKLYEN